MTCDQAEVLLATRASGGLSDADADALTRHLATCDGCRGVGVSLAPVDDDGGGRGGLPIVDPEAYEVGAEVARGGMGRILFAHDRRIGREVAIKELTSRSAELAQRFEREARLTARLQHPGIVPIYEIGAWPDGTPFYAMRLVRGGTLGDAIARATTADQRRALLPAVIAACDAVAFAHRHGVLHRDLTPANILRGDHGETVVIDWGLAKQLDEQDATPEAGPYREAPLDPARTAAGAVLGTVAYMAPEQARSEPVDARADVYALGAILHHVLSGRPPFDGDPETTLAAVQAGQRPRARLDGPRALVSIVTKAMAPAAADRYADAAALAGELRRFHDGLLVAAHTYSLRERLVRWGARHRLGLAVLLTAVVIATIGGSRVLRERGRAERIDQRARQARLEGLVEQARAAIVAGRVDDGGRLLMQARALGTFGRDARYLAARAIAGRTPLVEAPPWPQASSIRAIARIRPGTSEAIVLFEGFERGTTGWVGLERVDVRTGRHAPIEVPWPTHEPEPGGPSSASSRVEYSQDGALLLVSWGGYVGIWDAGSMTLRSRWVIRDALAMLVPGSREVLEADHDHWRRRDALTGGILMEAPASACCGFEAVAAGGRGVTMERFTGLHVFAVGKTQPDVTLPWAEVGGGWTVIDRGRRIVGCGDDGDVRVWEADPTSSAWHERTHLKTGVPGLHECAATEDGRRLVGVAGETTSDGRVRLVGFSLVDGAALFTLDAATAELHELRLVGDRVVASAGVSDTAVYDLAGGPPLTYHADRSDCDVSDETLALASVYTESLRDDRQQGRTAVTFIDLAQAGPMHRPTGVAEVIAIREGGRSGLGLDGRRALIHWDLDRGETALPALAPPITLARTVDRVASWTRSGVVTVVDGRGHSVRDVALGARPLALRLSPAGRRLLIVTADHHAQVVDVTSGNAHPIPGEDVLGGVVDDDGHVVICLASGYAWSHDLDTGTSERHGDAFCSSGWGVFGDVLVVGGATLRGVGVDAFHRRGTKLNGFVVSDATSIDRHGQWIVRAEGRDVTLTTLDGGALRDGQSNGGFASVAGPVHRTAISVESGMVGTDRGIWTVEGVQVATIAPTRPLQFMEFAADGTSLVAIDDAGTATIWDTRDADPTVDDLRRVITPASR